MRARPLILLLTVGLLASPAHAAQPANLLAPTTPALPGPPPCAAAERFALQAERARINGAIGDIALGKRVKRRKVSGGEVAAGVAGTAASVLLPFGIGALLGAGAQAAAKSGRKKSRKPAPPEPDVPAMIERLHAVDARLAELEACA